MDCFFLNCTCSFWAQLVQNPSGYISYRAFLAVTLPDDTRCNASILQALKRSKHREFGSVLLVTFGMVGREKKRCCKSMLYAEVFTSCIWNDQVEMMSSWGWQSQRWWIMDNVWMVRTVTMTTRTTTASVQKKISSSSDWTLKRCKPVEVWLHLFKLYPNSWQIG